MNFKFFVAVAGAFAIFSAAQVSSQAGGGFYTTTGEVSYDAGCPKKAISRPVHKVNLTRKFSISDHEVTQGEYKSVMGSLPEKVSEKYGLGDNYPVYAVTWYEAVEYCNKLSEKSGLKPAYTITETDDGKEVQCDFEAAGWRLPTEAEWEYAARAGDETTGSYVFSGTLDEKYLPEFARCRADEAGTGCIPVKSRKPNAYGLYDMTGNVSEWCWDWFYGFKNKEVTDPVGIEKGEVRAVRGSSWSEENAYKLALTHRMATRPEKSNILHGFRVCRTIDGKPLSSEKPAEAESTDATSAPNAD